MSDLCFQADVLPAGLQVRDSYDAATASTKRRSPPATVQREDRVLQKAGRVKIQANAQDLARNYAIAAWMVRQHLNYVAPHDFHPSTGDRGFDRELVDWMKAISRPDYFDAGRRCTREKWFRLAEARRVLDGDVFGLMIKDGTLEGIEGDRVQDPPRDKAKAGTTWIQGVRTGKAGQAYEYSIHNRGKSGTGYDFKELQPWTRVLHYGFFDRYASDQTRGVSPITTALNPLRDVYEAKDYALAKAKVSQLFALAFFRDADEAIGDDDPPPAAGTESDSDETDDATENGGPRYEVDFGKGPALLDLDAGDRAEFLESKNPSTEFVNFMSTVIMVAMKALDLPYSFYDESHSTWHGSRSGWLHYERSCRDKRDDQQELRRRWTLWRMTLGILDGDFTLPSKWTLKDVKFRWVPLGMAWWKQSEEVRGDIEAVAAGFDSPQEICLSRGKDTYEENVRKIIEAIKFAEEVSLLELGYKWSPRFDPGPPPTVINTGQ